MAAENIGGLCGLLIRRAQVGMPKAVMLKDASKVQVDYLVDYKGTGGCAKSWKS